MRHCYRLLVSLGILQGGASVIGRTGARGDAGGGQSADRFAAAGDDSARRRHGISPPIRTRSATISIGSAPMCRCRARPPSRCPAAGRRRASAARESPIPTTPEHFMHELNGSYVGTAWYRREVTAPADWAGKQVWLKIGGVNAQGWFWVNGVYVGHNESYCGAYKYNVTDLVQPGQAHGRCCQGPQRRAERQGADELDPSFWRVVPRRGDRGHSRRIDRRRLCGRRCRPADGGGPRDPPQCRIGAEGWRLARERCRVHAGRRRGRPGRPGSLR